MDKHVLTDRVNMKKVCLYVLGLLKSYIMLVHIWCWNGKQKSEYKI